MSGGRTKKTLLVDALEAVIAALYLDSDIETVRRFVESFVLDAPPDVEESEGTGMPAVLNNYKSALQELAQSRKLPQPRYVILREQGPEHAKTFIVEARVGPGWAAQGEGRTKKVAAQRAARTVYERLLGGGASPDLPPES
jgi:ribonuclease-3